ncbi:hypothetical protein ACWF82_20645 [Nocardia sp. NPDC055053]
MTTISRPSWTELENHHHRMIGAHISDLFSAQPGRGPESIVVHCDLVLGSSNSLLTAETIDLPLRMAQKRRLAAGIEPCSSASTLTSQGSEQYSTLKRRHRQDRSTT